MSRDTTCRGTTIKGKPCQSTIIVEDGFCEAHKPGGNATMKLRAQKGAEATRRKLKGAGLTAEDLGELETLADAQRWLKVVTVAIGERDITHSEGQAMTAAIREWVKAEADRLKAEDLEEIREELADFKRQKMKAV